MDGGLYSFLRGKIARITGAEPSRTNLTRMVAVGSVGRFEIPDDPDDQMLLPSFTELWVSHSFIIWNTPVTNGYRTWESSPLSDLCH